MTMKLSMKYLVAGALGGAIFILCARESDAGRIGGGHSWIVNIVGYRAASYDIPFAGRETAVITIAGSTTSNLDLTVSDDFGHVWKGVGSGANKTARIEMVQQGILHVEVENLGPATNLCIIGTN
jgi:hypothetical protein